MQKAELGPIKKEGWEVIRELHYLSDEEIRAKLHNCTSLEIDEIEGACYKADPGGSTGSDGGTHIARANAARAGMTLEEFTNTIQRIDTIIWEIKKQQSGL